MPTVGRKVAIIQAEKSEWMTNKFPAPASNMSRQYRGNLSAEEWLNVLDSMAENAMRAMDDDRFGNRDSLRHGSARPRGRSQNKSA